jgi:hypothetical protein
MGDESQHPTWPQLTQSRKWTQSLKSIFRHSWHPAWLWLDLNDILEMRAGHSSSLRSSNDSSRSI